MSRKILLVDDSMLVRSGLEILFKGSPNWDEVITAENGQEGIDLVLTEKPDAVCMDVEMPVKDGITALKEMVILKKQGKIDSKMPIVILSGTLYENEEQARKIRLYGATDIMAKPDGKSATVRINFKQLEAKILAALNMDDLDPLDESGGAE